MKKEHMIHIRVNKDENEEAREILDELGTNMSSVINMLIKNIILYRGIPFDVVLPQENENLENQNENFEGEQQISPKNVPDNRTIEKLDDDTLMDIADSDEDEAILDTSDLSLVEEMFGIPLGRKMNSDSHSTFNISGMLDD